MTEHEFSALLDDPARVLATPRAVLRDRLAELPAGPGGTGREVVSQAEMLLGQESVSRRERASWLHFAATVLGHGEYAAQVAAAEPGMPWRTLWAWWRPVGAYRAEPNLCGGATAEIRRDGAGRDLLRVEALWCTAAWFDLSTGARLAAAPDSPTQPADAPSYPEAPWLFEPDEDEGDPGTPPPFRLPTWEDPLALGDGRYLFTESRGVFVLQENPAPAGPQAGASDTSGTSGRVEPPGDASVEPWFAAGPEGAGPLTAARLASVFGAEHVLRRPDDRLPGALAHGPTRTLLAESGVPRHWAAGTVSFQADVTVPWTPGPAGLLRLGTFEFGYADTAEVLLDARTGEIRLLRTDGNQTSASDPDSDPHGGEQPAPGFRIARDTETFVRFLEGVRRHMGSCWDPYPGEGAGAFLAEMQALDPQALTPDEPSAEVWEYVFAGIVELGADGY